MHTHNMQPNGPVSGPDLFFDSVQLLPRQSKDSPALIAAARHTYIAGERVDYKTDSQTIIVCMYVCMYANMKSGVVC